MPKIVVLGEALIDLFAEGEVSLGAATSFRPSPGGAPANVAVALARLGASVGFVGKVGSDAFGELLQATLARHGVDTRHFTADARAPTMLAIVAAGARDEPQFILYNGANELLGTVDVPAGYIEEAAVFVYGSVSLATRSRAAALEAAEVARRAGKHVVFDVNLRPALWPDLSEARAQIEVALATANIAKANETELAFLTGTSDVAEGCRVLLDRGIEMCCASLGAGGSYLANPVAEVQIPAFEVETSNPTGCGDAFVAAVALRISELAFEPAQLDREELRQIGRFANACGAIVATQEGAMSAELDFARVQRLLVTRAR